MPILKKIITEYEKYIKGRVFIITLEDNSVIEFSIAKKRLKHLLGFQYTQYKNWRAELLYDEIKKRNLTYSKVMKDKNYKQIEIRILNFGRMVDLLALEVDDPVVRFDSSIMKNVKIKSKYIIFKGTLGHTLHLGVAEDGKTYYPETWFIRDDTKYLNNQEYLKIIKFEVKKIN